MANEKYPAGFEPTGGTFKPTKPADAEKQAAVLAEQNDFISVAGTLTEKLSKYVVLRMKEENISIEQAAFAVALLCINMREDFPSDDGGPAKFDEISMAAQDYYDTNVGK